MSQQLAGILCVLFILWLLVRDSKRRRVSSALWIPLTWVFIIGSKPLSTWLGFGDSYAGPESDLEGSPFDRVVFLFLIAAGLWILIRRNIDWSHFFRENRWLLVYFLYLGISAMWSEYPFVSFKRWIKDAGNVILVLVVLSEHRPLEAVKALLARCIYLLIPLSVLLVKYFPELGRYYDRWTYQPFFCGVATDKNLMGMSLFVCGLSQFWMLLELRISKELKRDKLEFYICMFLMILTFWLLFKSKSSTALGSTLLGCLILFGMRFPVLRRKARQLGLYSIGLVVIFIIFHVVLDVGGVFVGLFGRDLTFTGRTDIWTMLLKEPVNPIIGEGFYSFWMGDRVQRLSEKYFYSLNEAHNGYLETYLNVGLIGLVLLLALLAVAWGRIQREVVAGSEFAVLGLAFLATNLIYNVTEATFDRLDLLWFTLLLVIVKYPSPVKSLARQKVGCYTSGASNLHESRKNAGFEVGSVI